MHVMCVYKSVYGYMCLSPLLMPDSFLENLLLLSWEGRQDCGHSFLALGLLSTVTCQPVLGVHNNCIVCGTDRHHSSPVSLAVAVDLPYYVILLLKIFSVPTSG